MNKDKKDDRDQKAVSWYAAENSDAEIHIGENAILLGVVEAKDETRVRSSTFSEFSRTNKTRTSQESSETNTNPMEWLEVTLSNRRSDTRVYKYNTRLIECISDGDTAYMSRMLAMGANPNATCRLNHVSACHVAAMYDHDALALLISAGAERLRADKLGRTPLHLAAWAGNAKQIAILLNFPEALQESVASNMSPETVERVRAYSLVVHELTNTPCELNLQSTLPDNWSDGMEHNCRHIKETIRITSDRQPCPYDFRLDIRSSLAQLPLFQPGWTALHAASARAQHHCVQLLLAAGADPCAQDILCRTPLDVAGCAHYMEHNIEASNFQETIRILLKAGSKFQSRTASRVNTALHIAVELESEEIVEELLNNGASATYWNSQGLTAMHVCVKKRCKELLQLLLNYEYSKENSHVAIVDAKDLWGFTVLRAAVNVGWTQGVCIALGAGASVTMKANDGDTPIHAAAALGNLDILQEILTVAKFNSSIDFRNKNGETALFIAVRHNKTNVVKLLLEVGANIKEVSQETENVFHIAAQYGNKDILEYLLEYDSHITATLINSSDSKTFTPLAYAVSNNHPECVILLISKGAVVDFEVQYDDGISEEDIWTTPLHIAASKNYFEIARIIIDYDIKTIHVVNSVGRLPLHEACCHGNRNIIALLLHKGADLSGQNENGKTKLSPIDMLMNNLSKPTVFMQEMFDSCISSQGMNLQESNCEVTVDYGILVPNESDRKQMRVIKALVNTGNRYDQNRLLLHPLVQSFLYLKWKALLPFFYTILALHGCFVVALNVYVFSVFYYKDNKEEVPPYFHTDIWKSILYVTIGFIAAQEIVFIKVKNRRYFLCLETWLKFWAIALALLLPQVVLWVDVKQEAARVIATFALLLSWFKMMFLLSRFPDWGFYVLMFGKVANKVFKILLSFLFLIFGFSVCLMIQFRAKPPFEGPWASFVKTMVMMTSEYDYQTTINLQTADEVSANIIILRIIFLTFLILVSIVLMNLIVGVAVNNVNHLEMIGNIKRLEKQVEFITSLEDIVCHKSIRKFLPRKLYRRWSTVQKFKNVIVLRPREATCTYCKRLPARIREAIFEKAQLQKKQMDEELGSMVFKMKLDEIHNAIVRKDQSKPEKSDTTPDQSMDKIIEEIDNIRSDIEFIKNFLTTHRRRTLSSNKSSFL